MSSSYHHTAPAATAVSYARARGRASAPCRAARHRHPGTLQAVPALALVLLVCALFACVFLARTPGIDPDHTTTVRVSDGDSLWAIARTHPASGLDTARTVEVIRRLNRLESGTLVVGSTLRVPARDLTSVAAR